MPSVLLVEVEHSDAATYGGQTSADSLADPGAAAGDERDLTRVPTRDNVCIRHRGVPFLRRCRLDQGARADADRARVAVRATSATGDSYSEVSGAFLVLARGSSRTCADWKRMKPQLAQVRGNASVFLSTDLLPMTCSSATRSSQPCHCSWPQNGQLMRASRLLRKSKMRFTRIRPAQGDVVASPSLARTLSAGRCARSSVWAGCRDFAVVVGGSNGARRVRGRAAAFVTLEGGPRLGRSAGT